MNNVKRGIQPEHPGIILRELYVDALQLTHAELADNLGVTRVTINKLLNAKQSVTPEMAVRLSKAFKTSAEYWLNLQRNYDLWEIEHTKEINVKAIA